MASSELSTATYKYFWCIEIFSDKPATWNSWAPSSWPPCCSLARCSTRLSIASVPTLVTGSSRSHWSLMAALHTLCSVLISHQIKTINCSDALNLLNLFLNANSVLNFDIHFYLVLCLPCTNPVDFSCCHGHGVADVAAVDVCCCGVVFPRWCPARHCLAVLHSGGRGSRQAQESWSCRTHYPSC